MILRKRDRRPLRRPRSQIDHARTVGNRHPATPNHAARRFRVASRQKVAPQKIKDPRPIVHQVLRHHVVNGLSLQSRADPNRDLLAAAHLRRFPFLPPRIPRRLRRPEVKPNHRHNAARLDLIHLLDGRQDGYCFLHIRGFVVAVEENIHLLHFGLRRL